MASLTFKFGWNDQEIYEAHETMGMASWDSTSDYDGSLGLYALLQTNASSSKNDFDLRGWHQVNYESGTDQNILAIKPLIIGRGGGNDGIYYHIHDDDEIESTETFSISIATELPKGLTVLDKVYTNSRTDGSYDVEDSPFFPEYVSEVDPDKLIIDFEDGVDTFNGIIFDDDLGTSTFSIGETGPVEEGETAKIKILRHGRVTKTKNTSIQYATSGGNATESQDFESIDWTELIFEEGESEKTIEIQTFDDNIKECEDTFFFVNLWGANKESRKIYIKDNDTANKTSTHWSCDDENDESREEDNDIDETKTDAAPKLLKATLRGDRINLQFNDVISNTIPLISKFTITNGNREILVENAKVIASAGRVVLTTETKINPNVSATLDYLDLKSDESTGVIQSPKGLDLPSLNGYKLNNQSNKDQELKIDDGDYEGNKITLYLNSQINSSVPSAKRFRIKTDRKRLKITNIETDPEQGEISITTRKPLDSLESISVSYKDLNRDQTSGIIEDKFGNDMSTFRDFIISNGGYNDSKLSLKGAEIDDDILTIQFDAIIANTLPSKSRFNVKANGKNLRVTNVDLKADNDSFIYLSLDNKRNININQKSDVRLTYNDPKGDQAQNIIQDTFGSDLESFRGYSVEVI